MVISALLVLSCDLQHIRFFEFDCALNHLLMQTVCTTWSDFHNTKHENTGEIACKSVLSTKVTNYKSAFFCTHSSAQNGKFLMSLSRHCSCFIKECQLMLKQILSTAQKVCTKNKHGNTDQCWLTWQCHLFGILSRSQASATSKQVY